MKRKPSERRRIVPIETDPITVRELRDYDRGLANEVSDRAMMMLDILTKPKEPEDDTATALGFVALIADEHPSTLLPPDQVRLRPYLVSTSHELRAVSPYPGIKPEVDTYVPDGVYTFIPETNRSSVAPEQMSIAA